MTHRIFAACISVMFLGAGCTFTGESPLQDLQTSDENVGIGSYVMAFHACDPAVTVCTDPRNHQVYLAESEDGVSWRLVESWMPVAGSVPDPIQRDETIYVYTGQGKVLRYDMRSEEQEPAVNFQIDGVEDGVVDPSLFMGDDGRFVMFFLFGVPGQDPASCAAGETTCVKRIGSATEVAGSDGTRFVLDEDVRATVQVSKTNGMRTASDPDVFFDGDRYVLYISHGSITSAWVSDDLHGTFTQENARLTSVGGVASGLVNTSTGEWTTYAQTRSADGVTIIQRALHGGLEGISSSAWTTLFTSETIGLGDGVNVESPGILQW